MYRPHFAWRALFAAVAAVAAAVAAPAQAQNLFSNGDFSSGFTGWTQRNTSNGVGAPGSIVNFQTNPNLPASPAARFIVGQQVYRIGQREGVELVQYVDLQSGSSYQIAFDWAAQADPLYINGEGGIFEILVDGQSIAYDAVGIIGAGSLVRRSLSAQFTALRNGVHEVGARISRPHTVDPVSPRQYVDNFSMSSTGQRALRLVISGPCPGPMTFDISGATPSGLVGLLWARSAGSFVIPQGRTCAGTQLRLSGQGIQIVATPRADPSGNVRLVANISSGMCLGAWQAIDATTCRTSN